MLKDFREFIMRGNVLDLAVGIVIGAAFGAVVNSFVKDVLMPPIGVLLGGVDFANLFELAEYAKRHEYKLTCNDDEECPVRYVISA